MSRPMVVIACMTWLLRIVGPYRHPHPWHSRAGGGAVHSIESRLSSVQFVCLLSAKSGHRGHIRPNAGREPMQYPGCGLWPWDAQLTRHMAAKQMMRPIRTAFFTFALLGFVPVASNAQPVLAYVAAKDANPKRLESFKKGLAELGLAEGHNIRLEHREAVLDSEYDG